MPRDTVCCPPPLTPQCWGYVKTTQRGTASSWKSNVAMLHMFCVPAGNDLDWTKYISINAICDRFPLFTERCQLGDWWELKQEQFWQSTFYQVLFVRPEFSPLHFLPKPPVCHTLTLISPSVFLIPFHSWIFICSCQKIPWNVAQEGWFTPSHDHSWHRWIHEQGLQAEAQGELIASPKEVRFSILFVHLSFFLWAA